MPKIVQFNGKGKNPLTNFRNTPTKKIISPGGLLLSRDDLHLELKYPEGWDFKTFINAEFHRFSH